MAKLIPFVVIATAAALGACSTPPQTGGATPPTPKVVTNVHPYIPGTGVVQSVSATPVFRGAGTPAAEPMQRLEIKMDNGKIQYVDVPSREFTRGTRVTLTDDRLIRRAG